MTTKRWRDRPNLIPGLFLSPWVLAYAGTTAAWNAYWCVSAGEPHSRSP